MINNVERPGFRNFKTTNIKITKDDFFLFTNLFLIFQNEIVKFKKFFFFYLKNHKVSEI